MPPQYDFTTENAIAIAADQQVAFESRVVADRHDVRGRPQRRGPERRCSRPPCPTCRDAAATRSSASTPPAGRPSGPRPRGSSTRRCARELRDTEVAGDADAPGRPDGRRARRGRADARRRAHRAAGRRRTRRSAPTLTDAAHGPRPPPTSSRSTSTIRQGEVIVRNGDAARRRPTSRRSTPSASASRCPDVASFGGWLAARGPASSGCCWPGSGASGPALWHRDNVLLLIGLLRRRRDARAQGHGRPPDPAVLPADRGDRRCCSRSCSTPSIATIVIAIVARHRRGRERQLARVRDLHLPRRLAGIVAVRRGDRLQVFVQAALAVFVVNALVVTVFSLLGARDLRGVLELWFASAAVGGGVGRSPRSARSRCSARCSGS